MPHLASTSLSAHSTLRGATDAFSMAKYDAIIIGCGMSGLAAARQLAPFKVAILEARNRHGGRILTADSATGLKEPVDLGGSMVHGYREGNPVARLITAELGMVSHPFFRLEPLLSAPERLIRAIDSILFSHTQEVHVPDGAKGLVYGPEGPLAEADATSLFATSAQNSFVPQPGTSPSTSVADLLLPKLTHDPRLVALARTAEIGAGVALEEQSAKFAGFEQGFKGTDGFPVGGYGEVIANLASDVKASGGEIHLDTVVTSIEDVEEEEGACVKVTAENGETFTARAVISTIPHAVLQQNPPKFSPPLPTSFTSALARIRTGALEKIVLSYPSAWWPSPDQTGSFLLLPLEPTTGDNNNKSDSLEALFASTVIPVTSFERIGLNPHPTLLAYIGASAAKVLARYSTDEVADAFHAYLVKRLDGAGKSSSSQTPPAPSTKLVTTWLSDPFSLGATSAPVTLPSSSTTTTTADGDDFSTPLDYILVSRPAWQGRLGFAGEHTDLDNHGSVAGAFISGKREGMRVKELLERLAAQEAERAAAASRL